MENIEDLINRIDSSEKEKTKTLLMRYLKRWPWFLAFCVTGILIGYFIFKNSPETYQVSSRILVKSAEAQLSSALPFDKPVERNNSSIENQIGILKSYTLYRKALDSLNWKYSWFEKKLFYNDDLYKNDPFELIIPPNAINSRNLPVEIEQLNDNEYQVKVDGETYINGYAEPVNIEEKIQFGKPFVNDFFNFTVEKKEDFKEGTFLLNFNNLNSLTSTYLVKTNIYSEENSDFIIVMIEGQMRRRDVDFINALNRVFIEFGMQNKYKTSESSVEFIDSQLARIKNSLGTAEENFSNYRKNNQVMNLGQEAQMVYQRLEEVEQEKYLTQLQIDYYKELLQYIDDSKKIEEMINPSYVGINDANLSGMLTKLMELYSRKEVLSYSVQDKAPSLILLEKEIKLARDALEETLKNQLKTTETKMESLNERYISVQGRMKKLPETEKKLVSIQREFDLNNELYTYMMQKKAEASISKASIAPEVQIIDNAMVEASLRIGPNVTKFVGIGFIGGFIIPFLFITLLAFFDNKIQAREEIERIIQIPVLDGIIQHKYKVVLPVVQYPRSGIAESFRGLKSNLNAMLDKPGSKVISINSLIPGEGKSFISSNFSAILTKTNKKVLLIGADLHNPTLHKYFNIKETLGLSNYLKGEISMEEMIMTTSIPNLSIIQAGPVPENPSDLPDNVKIEQLIDFAKRKFDFIIIDNAPLLLVPDAISTSNFSDVSLFILRMNYSHKDQIKQINKIVEFNNIKQAALVINETPDRGFGYGKKYWKKGYGEYRYHMSIA
ncbi:MAG: polysaccharide biosynthesis tyrosine autokinase [Draconibacterium sp.]